MANRHNFLDYTIATSGIQKTAGKAYDLIKNGNRKMAVNTINAHSTCVAEDDSEFKSALQNSDILIPDGASIVLGARLLGTPVDERVSGYDFFTAISALAEKDGSLSCFFLGSSDQVLEKIEKRFKQDYPSVRVAGTLSPPFKPVFTKEDNDSMIETINSAKPDILWVGMTAPKQEKWIEENRQYLDIGFASAIGAVFDFYAGTKKRAPQWAQKHGLEWFHRLISEPKRVWRRYLINNPRFVFLVLKAKLSSLLSRKG